MTSPTEAVSPPDIYSEAFGRNPYPFYHALRDHHPVHLDPVSGRYLISRHADVQVVLGGDGFSTRAYDHVVEPVYGRTLMQEDGSEHARQRRFLTPLFQGAGLRQIFEPAIDRVVDRLVARFAGAGEVELVDAFTAWFGVGIVADVLGVGEAEEPLILDWYSRILAYQFNLEGDPEVHADGLRASAEARAFLAGIVADRRQRPGGDLISALLGAEVAGETLDDEYVTSFCTLLIVAGSETTDKAAANLVKNLLEHPDVLERVRADRSLVDRAFAETLRFSPPLHMIVRTAAEDVELSGCAIPAGAEVLCMVGAANRDPRVFPDADAFDIHRPEQELRRAFTAGASHAAFGWGRHFCLGAQLAQVETRVAANALLDAMPDVRFAPGFTPREEGIWARAPRRLDLVFRRR
ncbi:MAG: cytochrome P450 [Actinobacteria bacterium]|nr:cytochrome P450 [Actinomycetota bacterium]